MAIIHHTAQHRFVYIDEDGTQAGELDYRYLSERKIDAYHTGVDPAFRGKGIAGKLYDALIEFTQQQNLKIKPSCSYIEIRMERSHPELIA
ncbi:GNAT family N-acetyltransferase [Glaesserella sp.]|uniref:GNAT family N-acetyltransferase n=1 Tax=Glaesserella sp. TaxID=2094731 RepID=UPI00359F461C